MHMDACGADEIQAWVALSRAHDLLAARLDEALRTEVGLSLPEHDILEQVVAGCGMLQMGDVARTLVISKSGVTRLVGKLEAEGLLERVTFPQNRRATFASLTDAGRGALAESEKVFAQVLAETFAVNLTETDVRNLRRALGKLLDAHGWSPPQPCQEWARLQAGAAPAG
jgi:DNA-binding MarR family transcriptional regulator